MIRQLTLAAAIAMSAVAESPSITELQPRGAERGRSFMLTVLGRDIPEGAAISSTMPATFTAVVPNAKTPMMMAPGRYATFLVEPKQDLSPGVYPIRLTSSHGISNILLFSIGAFPEQTEEESAPYSPPNRNDSIETAQPIQSTPVTVNGTLRGAERDLYRVYGKAGERRVFEVDARRAGSAIDPVLRILDGNGKQLARSEDSPGAGLDARLDFTFPREGNYYVEVHDARFSRQVQNFYRLKMGNYPFAEGIFPLGGRAGEATEVTLFGGNLPAAAKAKITPGQGRFEHLAVPGSQSYPFLFATSDLPERLEPVDALQIPGVVNGRLNEPGEIDRYKLQVTPGEKLLFEIQARELGTSRIEGVLTVYDSSGKKIDSAGDKPLPEDVFVVQGTSRTSSDPFLNLTVPEGVTEITVAVEDLAQRGGPFYAYRLISRRLSEDFDLALGTPHANIPAGGSVSITVTADRRGYDGPIQITVPELPKGITATGGIIPREYVDPKNARSVSRRGVVVLTAEPGVAANLSELIVYGEGKGSDGGVIRRRARGPAMVVDVAGAVSQGVVDRQRPLTASWLGFDLPAALSTPQTATLEVWQTKVTRMEEGERYEFAFRWDLKSPAAKVNNLNVDVVGARDIRVTNMERSKSDSPGMVKGSFYVHTTKNTEAAKYDMIVRGKVQSDGVEEDVVAKALPFVVDRSEKN